MTLLLKTDDEIESMRRVNLLVGETLAELSKYIRAGVATLTLNNIAEQYLSDHQASAAFNRFSFGKNRQISTSVNMSINNNVVYGIPSSNSILKDGDIITIDCGAKLKGFFGECCFTFPVGVVDQQIKKFLSVAYNALYIGIQNALPGNHLGDISQSVEQYVTSFGYQIIGKFAGHGIGKESHEAPQIPNDGKAGKGMLLRDGMCLTIDPIISFGTPHVKSGHDGCSYDTRNMSLIAHYKHTIALHHGTVEILSSFEKIKKIIEQTN